MELSIIILNYKNKNLVKYQLKKLYYYKFDFESEIIVIDNNSRDKIKEILEKDFPKVKLLQAKKNRGYGAGNNIGMRKALGKYLLILNPDIRISKNSIEKLYEAIKDKNEIGIVAPKLINADKSVQNTCFKFPNYLYPIYRRTFLGKNKIGKKWLKNFLMKNLNRNQNNKVDWIMGACFMIKKNTLEKIGYFDKNFFMYLEDMDLCRRVWQNNQIVYYLGKISAIHLHQKASDGKNIFQLLLFNRLSRAHLKSWFYYIFKYRNRNLPKNCPSQLEKL